MRERSGSELVAEQRIMVTPPGYEQQTQGGGGGVSGGGMDASLAVAAASQPILLPHHETQFQDQAQLEVDKRAVYKHPLFPLLALLFEKCEMATRTSADSPFSDSFHQDLEAFVQHQERDRKPFLLNDREVDGLMIKAIQVLRIHLLELDKVQELCKDFCNRYIACLKGKMQSENLLRSDYFDSGSGGPGGMGGGGYGGGGGGGASLSSNSNSPHHSSYSSNGELTSASPPINMHHPHHNNNSIHFLQQNPSSLHHQYPPSSTSPEDLDPPHVSGGESGGTPPMGLVHGGTPLSQIGANSCPPQPPSSSSGSGDPFVQGQCDGSPGTQSSGEDDDDYLGGRKKPKRGVLPKHATSIMRSWLFQHIVHPYPTEDEKRQIAAQTNLTLLQVNNWFINARRRILQPMLDASNPETPAPPKVKKMKTNGSSSSSKPGAKFWSDNNGSNPTGTSPRLHGEDEENDSGGESESDEEMSSNPDQDQPDPNDVLIDNSESSQQ